MKRVVTHTFYLFALFVFLIPESLHATTYYSIGNGNWTDKTIWSTTPGGSPCNCYPKSSDNVNIYHTITLDMHLTNSGSKLNGITGILTIFSGGFLNGGSIYDVDIRSTGTLILECGNVTARDVTFSNGSSVTVCSTATLTVNGNFENKNNSDNVTINGTMNVAGSYSNGNGGLIAGTGVINITAGPVNNVGNTYGCTNMNPCSSFPCAITSPCNFSLSNELKSFEVKKDSKRVHLKWTTITEKNNDYFNIERSSNGMDYEIVKQIDGSGNSSDERTYVAFDESPLDGLSYYRLNQVTFDGANGYSEAKTVMFSTEVSVTFYPNPIIDERAKLKISGEEKGSLYIEIRDYNGRNTYLKKVFELDANNSTINLDELQGIPNGVYIAAIKSDSFVYNEMLIIAR